jgi:nucleotide-binding universal stress UspA family protein
MGGYGHGRTREALFGGFTNDVLKGCDLPVLMFH